MVKSLLRDSRVDPSIINSETFYTGLDIVVELFNDKRVDPGARYNQAIISACGEGRLELVKFLLQDPRVYPATSKWVNYWDNCGSNFF